MAEPSNRRRGFPRPEIVNAEPELLAYLERLDAFDPDAWERALELKSQVEPYAFDEAPSALRELGPHGVFVADDGEKGEVVAARHPASRASFGFVGQPVDVRFEVSAAASCTFHSTRGQKRRSI